LRNPHGVARSIRRARKWLRYAYSVPWCVPPWGWKELAITLETVLKGRVVSGSSPERFAEAVAEYLGVRYALPVARGRIAIELALRAMGIGKNDDVVFPSYVCHSVLQAVIRSGARPVFADVGPDLNVTPDSVLRALTPATRCVIVPHLFGNPAPIGKIEEVLSERDIALIDDAAQALGTHHNERPVGTFGVCGIVSCGPGKPLAGPGGGLLLTNDRTLLARAASVPLKREPTATVVRRGWSFWTMRRLRRYTLPFRILLDRLYDPRAAGPEPEYVPTAMPNLEGVLAIQQLKSLAKNAESRRANAFQLIHALGPLARWRIAGPQDPGALLKLVLVVPSSGPSVRNLLDVLHRAGIECQRGYTPCHRLFPRAATVVPFTEHVWSRVICLPLELPFRNAAGLGQALRESGIDDYATGEYWNRDNCTWSKRP
jgi:dTDP-4-amino-4,6-dideoxygalactose transaminase